MPELPEVYPPAAVPATIDPAAWEDFPVFRESFLMYISEPAFNASLRTAAEHFFTHDAGVLRALARVARVLDTDGDARRRGGHAPSSGLSRQRRARSGTSPPWTLETPSCPSTHPESPGC